MVRISARVSSGPARFRVAIRAASVRRALEIAEGLNPGRDDVGASVRPGAFSARAVAGWEKAA